MARPQVRQSLIVAPTVEVTRALDYYRASPTQAAFHQSTRYYNLVTGGGRAGKTTSCLADLAWDLLGIHPYRPWCGPFTALIFAVSRQQSAMVGQKKLLEQCELPGELDFPAPVYDLMSGEQVDETTRVGDLPLIPREYIAEVGSTKIGFRSVNSFKLKNGCQVYYSWADADDTWKRIQGPKIGAIYIDENAGSKKLLIEARKRLVDSQHPGSWLGRLTWGAHGTEVNDAFDDFRARCEDPEDNDHAMFRLVPGETGAVDKDAIARFAATLSEDERKIHITGESTSGSLVQIYGKQWDDKRHVLTPQQADVRADDNLWAGYDPGVDHPTGLLIMRLRSDMPNRLVAVKEWFRRGGTIDEDIRELSQWLQGRRLAGFVYDTNLKNKDRGGGPSLLSQFKQKCSERGIVPVGGWWQSKKNHAPGISLVRGMLDPTPGDPRTPPLLQASSDCGTLISQIKRYRGKEETRFTGEGGVVKKYDELVDALRYLAMASPCWRSEYACGQSVEPDPAEDGEDGPTLTLEQAQWQNLLRLSATAGARRQRRGGLRVSSN